MACQCGKEDNNLTVPYVVHESEMARSERREKRLWVVVLVLIAALVVTNIGWLIYEAQFETIYWEQDGDGLNNMNTGDQGDVTLEPAWKVQEETERQAQWDAFGEPEPQPNQNQNT